MRTLPGAPIIKAYSSPLKVKTSPCLYSFCANTLDGERQKERFDNDAIIDQLEAKIRAKVAQQDPKNRII